ncbi:uncharacterized protein MONOS_11059 [Monocercomonoides exilis]|uniref:uncharacterized protein n=1 Tax=Monocercomonoides exilis TaxID=2049356 RepID=UPI00355ABDD6|nr:hypothetical protein MONOS_11059 [Monocercomonoides exilis]|eukprot:MONOS_11059.1-p1 / transcript=MONOS_11059.1 / gene=MONOS_11059 / organism=Monocercomonoides_exilis_PA203 / gene_product=unspecified product / transcript_product=unspecified product / location=Mono_scaffold00533:38795-39022(+) / protein_length=76 / sequence_SO=supercontig / SO=protein_coding / is_pseudo=false
MRLRIVVPEAAGVSARNMPLSLLLLLSSPFALKNLLGYVVALWAVLCGGVVRIYNFTPSAMLSVLLVVQLPSLAV